MYELHLENLDAHLAIAVLTERVAVLLRQTRRVEQRVALAAAQTTAMVRLANRLRLQHKLPVRACLQMNTTTPRTCSAKYTVLPHLPQLGLLPPNWRAGVTGAPSAAP